MSGVNVGGAMYSHELNDRGAWAVIARFADYGKFTETSADNQILGTFNVKDIAVGATIGYDITDRLRGGATANFIYSAYESYTSIALGVNLGLNYYNPDTDFSLSIVGNNLGGQLKEFAEQRESLPCDLQVGLSKSLAHAPFRFSITTIKLTSWKKDYIDNSISENSGDNKEKSNFAKDLFSHVVVGIDYLPNDNFYLAVGYNYKKRRDFEKGGGGFLTGFSGGFGINIRMFDINASIARYHRAGTSFMLGVNLQVDKF